MKTRHIYLFVAFCLFFSEVFSQNTRVVDATFYYRTAPISMIQKGPTVSNELGILPGFKVSESLKLIGGIGFGLSKFPISVKSVHDVFYEVEGHFIAPQAGLLIALPNTKLQLRFLSRFQHTSLKHQLNITTIDDYWGKQTRELKAEQKYWMGAADVAILLPISKRIHYALGICSPLGITENPFQSITAGNTLFQYTPALGTNLLFTFSLNIVL
jgi:hypothetical protein